MGCSRHVAKEHEDEHAEDCHGPLERSAPAAFTSTPCASSTATSGSAHRYEDRAGSTEGKTQLRQSRTTHRSRRGLLRSYWVCMTSGDTPTAPVGRLRRCGESKSPCEIRCVWARPPCKLSGGPRRSCIAVLRARPGPSLGPWEPRPLWEGVCKQVLRGRAIWPEPRPTTLQRKLYNVKALFGGVLARRSEGHGNCNWVRDPQDAAADSRVPSWPEEVADREDWRSTETTFVKAATASWRPTGRRRRHRRRCRS